MSKTQNTLTEFGDAVTDGLNDAWAATAAFAQELAASAADAAGDLTNAAGSGLSDGADRLGSLYDAARQRVHPAPRRRVSPWLLVGAALAAFVAAGWWLRRRRASQDAVTRTSGIGTPVDHAAGGRSAAGN